MTTDIHTRERAAPPSPPPPPRQRRSPLVRREERAAWGFLAPSGIGFAIFTILPIIGSLVIAFFFWPVIGLRSPAGLANFEAILTDDPVFWRALLNTSIFVFLYVPLNIALSLGIALWISPRIKGRAVYRVLFFLPAVTPIVANALVWRLILQPRGLVDAGLGEFGIDVPNLLGSDVGAMLAVVGMSLWQGFGYNMLVFSAGLDAIPEQMYEAAAIDGAGRWRQFVSITLPMLSPSMFFAAILTIITSFQVFAQPYILTGGGPGVATQTLVMYMYQRGFQFYDLGQASAISVVLFLVIGIVTAIQFFGQKRWVHYES